MREVWVNVRYVAQPEHRLDAAQRRAPCEACAFVAPAPTCEVMRKRMVALGLPDCEQGFVYLEEGR